MLGLNTEPLIFDVSSEQNLICYLVFEQTVLIRIELVTNQRVQTSFAFANSRKPNRDSSRP
jgi:hypothetical protein